MKHTAFSRILTRDNNTVAAQRAEQWSKQFSKAALRKVDDVEEELDKLKDEVLNMTDMSTSNDLQTANRQGSFDADAFAENLFRKEYEIQLLELKHKAYKKTYDKYCEEIDVVTEETQD